MMAVRRSVRVGVADMLLVYGIEAGGCERGKFGWDCSRCVDGLGRSGHIGGSGDRPEGGCERG